MDYVLKIGDKVIENISEITYTESEKPKFKRTFECEIELSNSEIEALRQLCPATDLLDSTFEYYLYRQANYYFRNNYTSMKIGIDMMDEWVMEKLRKSGYGTKINITIK